MRVEADEFYWRSGSGTTHRGLSRGGIEMTAEGCNRDEANDTVMDEFPEQITQACKRCFPPIVYSEEAVAV